MSTLKPIGKAVLIGLCFVLFLAGLAVTVYPFVSNASYESDDAEVVVRYEHLINENAQEARLAEMRASARIYNDNLLYVGESRFPLVAEHMASLAEGSDEQQGLSPAFESDELPSYESLLSIDEKGMMATLEIPKIGVSLPIYHGTSNETLSQGVGHIEGTSLPIGGKGSHSVLTAHAGLSSRRLFTDLDQLVLGDRFTVQTVTGPAVYAVDQILVVEPNDVESLAIDPDEDQVTLVTCTPYGLNTHRLLVRGTRVASDTAVNSSVENVGGSEVVSSMGNWQQDYARALALVGGGVVVVILVAVIKRVRKVRTS